MNLDRPLSTASASKFSFPSVQPMHQKVTTWLSYPLDEMCQLPVVVGPFCIAFKPLLHV